MPDHRTARVYVYTKNDDPAVLLFETVSIKELHAVVRFTEKMKHQRVWVRCQKCLDVPGKDGLGRTCKGCGGSGEIKRQ